MVNNIKKEIEKATKHLNNEMDEAAEEFYQTKKNKKKKMAYHYNFKYKISFTYKSDIIII